MWAIGLVVGAFIGGAYDGEVGVLGAVAGLVAGILAGSWKKRLLRRVSELEARVDGLIQSPDFRKIAPPVLVAEAASTAAHAPESAAPPTPQASAALRFLVHAPRSTLLRRRERVAQSS